MPGDLMVILSHVSFTYQLSSDDPLDRFLEKYKHTNKAVVDI